MKEIEGIIIYQVAQKEKDAMLSFLTEEGLLSIYARGVKDNKSKNAYAINAGCLSSLEINEGRLGGKSLKSATLISYLGKNLNSLLDYACFNYALELARKADEALEDKASAYKALHTFLTVEKNDDSIAHLLAYISQILIILGERMKIDGCVFCNNKNEIITYSLDDGGLVCQNHFDKGRMEKESKDQINLLRFLFMAKQAEATRINLSLLNYLHLLNQYQNFLKDNLGIDVKSFTLFKPFFSNL